MSVAMPDPLFNLVSKAARLAELRTCIRRLEGLGGADGDTLPLGVPALDAALPDGGLPLGCLHEVAAEDRGAGTAFATALLARLAAVREAPVLWIVRGRDLHAAGLAAYGLTPDRLIVVRAVRDADALWVMEEALRCKRLSAVLGETGRLDLIASRRLQLAAEAGGVTGLLLRLSDERARVASVAVTRWRVAPALSAALPGATGDEPGVGELRWHLDLLRCRGGCPGSWEVGWRDGALVGATGAARVERFAAVA
ncbi:ImuA family protein [Azospirillum sp. sgz301742]